MSDLILPLKREYFEQIKAGEKDFYGSSPLWDSITYWEASNDLKEAHKAANRVDKAVQRLIKKYVKREREKLARVMEPTTITKEELIEILKQERENNMNWPADLPGKH